MAKRPEQHKIDDAAKGKLKSILEDISSVAEQHPDYGIDFRVQLLDQHNNLTSDVFLVQLKGHKNCKLIRKNHQKGFSQSLSVERLNDYLEVYKEPVCLIVIDTTQKIARYVFMQNYLDSGLLPSDWRSQDTVNIFLPAENDLQNQAKFRKDLKAATQYLCNKYPGTPNAAIQHANKRYQEIDPRFEIKWHSNGDTVIPHYVPKEPVDFKITLSPQGSNANDRMQRFLHTGMPTEFLSDEINFEGSPLFEQFQAAGKLIIQYGQTQKIFISVKCLNTEDHEIGRVDGLAGQLTAGQKQYHFNAEIFKGLLSLKGGQEVQEKGASTCTFNFQINKWTGLPIKKLPFFEEIYSVFGKPNLTKISFDIIPAETGKVLVCEIPNLNPQLLKTLSGLLRLIKRMQNIATLLEIEPRLKEKLTDDEIQKVGKVYQILSKGKRVTDCTGASIQGSCSKNEIERMLKVQGPGSITIINDQPIDFYADSMVIGKRRSHFSKVDFHNREKLIVQMGETEYPDTIHFQMDCSEGCVLTETIELNKPLSVQSS